MVEKTWLFHQLLKQEETGTSQAAAQLWTLAKTRGMTSTDFFLRA
jgi:hypothetical protein